MKPLLSILIPTVVGREKDLKKLILSLTCFNGLGLVFEYVENEMDGYKFTMYKMYNYPFTILTASDNKQKTIGEKREWLYKQSDGIYSIMIDDDDLLAPNAIELILNAIKSNPDVDVISFEEYCNMDGKEYKSNHSATYSGWEGDGNSIFNDGFHFHRTPFFKDVIRTELARSVPVVHCRFGEDNLYADALHPLIKSEVHIDSQIYKYIHISSPFNERYGINKD